MKYNLLLSDGGSFQEHEYNLFKEISIFISKLWENKIIQRMYLLTCGYNIYSKHFEVIETHIETKRHCITINVRYNRNFLENLSAGYDPYVQTSGFQKNKKQFVVFLSAPRYNYRIIFNFDGEFLIVDNNLKDPVRREINCHDTKVFHILNSTYKKVLPTYLDMVSKIKCPYQPHQAAYYCHH